MIMSFEKFGLILYFNILQKVFDILKTQKQRIGCIKSFI